VGVGVLEEPFLQLRECLDLGERYLLKMLPIGLDALVHVVVVVSTFPETRTELLKLVVDKSSLLQRTDIRLKV